MLLYRASKTLNSNSPVDALHDLEPRSSVYFYIYTYHVKPKQGEATRRHLVKEGTCRSKCDLLPHATDVCCHLRCFGSQTSLCLFIFFCCQATSLPFIIYYFCPGLAVWFTSTLEVILLSIEYNSGLQFVKLNVVKKNNPLPAIAPAY